MIIIRGPNKQCGPPAERPRASPLLADRLLFFLPQSPPPPPPPAFLLPPRNPSARLLAVVCTPGFVMNCCRVTV